MVTEELKKNQTKTANQTDANYTVVVEGGGAVCQEKPVLEALLPGIRLHFLRYGLFYKKDKNNHALRVKDENDSKFTFKDVDAANGDLQSTDNFVVAQTALRAGFIYLINEDNINDHHELKVDDSGNLSHVIWNGANLKENGTANDFRTGDGKSTHYKLVVKNEKDADKKYRVCFSPVQWSYAYHKTMLDDAEKRNQHMILVECKAIAKGNEECAEHILPYNKVEIAYQKGEGGKQKIESTLRQVDQIEKREERRGNNEAYEDLFVTLHDPIGCTQDIADVLGDKTLDFKALVEGIQTGHSLDTIKSKLLKGEAVEPVSDEYKDLYNLALTTYKMVYSDKETIRKYDGGDIGFNWLDNHFPDQAKPKGYSSRRARRYKYPPGYEFDELYIGHGVDQVKVKGILGVDIRNAKRTNILALRKEYWDYIQTDYLKNVLAHYVDNSAEHCVYGKEIIHQHLLLIYNNPYNYDKHLLHEQDYVVTDNIIREIDRYLEKENVTNNEDNLERILVEQITLAKSIFVEIVDVLNKFAGATAAKLELHSNAAFKAKLIFNPTTGKPMYNKIIQTRNTHILKRINRIQVSEIVNGPSKEVFFVGGYTHRIIAKTELLGIKDNLQVDIKNADGTTNKFTGSGVKHKPIYGKEAIAKGGSNQLDITSTEAQKINKYQYQKNLLNEKKYSEKVAKSLNSRGFTGVLFGLQTINIINSVSGMVETLSDERSSDGQKYKSALGAFGTSVDVTEAFLNLRQAHLRSIGTRVSEKLASRTAFIGTLGGVLTSGMCFWDASVAYGNRDVDSAMAWALAGVAFGAATTAGVVTSLAAASAAGTLSSVGTVVVGTIGAEAIGALALLSNPVGWICLGIGVGLVIAAYLLSDDELEFYFKHFLLNDRKGWPVKSNQLPMGYTQSILDNKKLLMDTDDKDILNSLMEPADAIASLFDHTIATNISYHAPFEFKSDWHGSGRSARRKVYGYNVSLVVKRFLTDSCQIVAKGVLLDGTTGKPEEFDIVPTNDTLLQTEHGAKYAASFVLPPKIKNNVGKFSKLILALRIQLGGNDEVSFFPYPLKSKNDRYMGTYIRLYESKGTHMSNNREQEITFDNIEALIKKWQ